MVALIDTKLVDILLKPEGDASLPASLNTQLTAHIRELLRVLSLHLAIKKPESGPLTPPKRTPLTEYLSVCGG